MPKALITAFSVLKCLLDSADHEAYVSVSRVRIFNFAEYFASPLKARVCQGSLSAPCKARCHSRNVVNEREVADYVILEVRSFLGAVPSTLEVVQAVVQDAFTRSTDPISEFFSANCNRRTSLSCLNMWIFLFH